VPGRAALADDDFALAAGAAWVAAPAAGIGLWARERVSHLRRGAVPQASARVASHHDAAERATRGLLSFSLEALVVQLLAAGQAEFLFGALAGGRGCHGRPLHPAARCRTISTRKYAKCAQRGQWVGAGRLALGLYEVRLMTHPAPGDAGARPTGRAG
jgi:hypothetical protein